MRYQVKNNNERNYILIMSLFLYTIGIYLSLEHSAHFFTIIAIISTLVFTQLVYRKTYLSDESLIIIFPFRVLARKLIVKYPSIKQIAFTRKKSANIYPYVRLKIKHRTFKLEIRIDNLNDIDKIIEKCQIGSNTSIMEW